ncbi:glucosamine--fructose-6-phosphate aminotransferase (isomerizing) [Desulfobaculum xiamenense]|uniref:Glutamine--fructose-6-phosphate aminotransferase [isomerizing] n=1 Tax=Desulfobaculum xiamenense TaxID=995050 RepID=A0A846QMN8_9BACT|nr:glutamine--fructose-6-phosphate transaminase (isomerizing) [Desulfobaculum xiamenense]NJB68290.1 glucosamine--fructose-6-phosphate aminotransferase (isomerizing) [Desulfobaculum xiamenense]
MCGIIGYAGHRPAVPVLVEGLRRLEYRGYDSAGVAFIENREMHILRAEGKLSSLENKIAGSSHHMATTGIGHTRWATHGVPVERNAHPHRDNSGRLALIHNGIIENYQEQKSWLAGLGYTFSSETDTEVLVNLVAEGRKHTQTLMEALSWALARVEGAYAVALLSIDEPNTIYAARQSSPLVFGRGVGENFVASDIPAFLPYTREVVFLEDGEMVKLDPSGWQVFDAKTLAPIEKELNHITWDVQAAQKGGYKHFMLKEIFEQPRVVADCIAGRADAVHGVRLPELDGLAAPKRLHIVACGTSYHAGLWGMGLIESWARIPVRVEIASEFRYRDLILDKDDVVLAISQSGETADTLAGMRRAREMGATVIGLCNVVGSTVSREADHVIYTQAGPEISVASTKAMCSQLTLLLLLALHWGRQKGTLPADAQASAVRGLVGLPSVLEAELPRMREVAQSLSRKYSSARSFMYLGRGVQFPLALEGALKLKEISYIHAEGYASGEMKHGPIALIDPEFPTFALALHDDLFPKVKSNLEEVQARDGRIVAITHPGLELPVDDAWVIPEVWGPLNSFLVLPCLQLFAYEVADYLGKDVDQPRNLAKSVTVE